ncbi:unnamed protein product, partial [Adineta steineri]
MEDEKKKTRNVRIQTSREINPFNDERIVYQQLEPSKNIPAQTELTAITFNNEQKNYRQHVRSKRNKINNDLSHTSDTLNLNLNAEEALHQREQEILDEDFDNAMAEIRTTGENTTVDQDMKATTAITDTEPQISPILGYADEPLLPLSKACTPLNDLLHNISFYTQLALDETPEQPPDGLTIDESAAIRLYTIEWDKPHRSLYSMLNYHLKNNDRQALLPYFKYIKLFVTALVKLPCIPPLTVWRGVTKNLSVEFPPGTEMTWWAFSSCTTEMTVLENNMYLGNEGDRTLFSVEVMNGRTIK